MFGSRSLRAFYAFTVCWAFNPTSGLWILYLLHCHWSLFQVGLAESGFHLVSFLAEVPTGLFADRWGRRKSLAAGLSIQALTTATTFWLAPHSIALGTVSVACGALAWSFIGGADRALLFGIVSQDAQASTFGRVYGAVLAVHLAVSALATALGGWLVIQYGWSRPYEIAVASAVLGLTTIGLLPQPRAPKVSLSPVPFGHNVHQTFRIAQATPGLGVWIGFGALLATLITINNLYAQSTLVLKGASLPIASLLVATASVVSAIGGWQGGRLTNKTGKRMLSWGTCLMGIFVAAVGLVSWPMASVGYLGAAAMDGVLDPVYETELNRLVPETLRATLLSLPSMGFSLGMLVLFPLAGWAMSIHHLPMVYLLIGGGLAALGLGLSGWPRRQHLKTGTSTNTRL